MPKQRKIGGKTSSLYFLPIIVALLGSLLYLNTINHSYVLDDASAITENRFVKEGVEGIKNIMTTSYRHGYDESFQNLYRPLSLVMFAIEWEIAPNNPFLGHLINIILYGFTGFLLFYTLLLIFGKDHLIFVFLVSLLFISHPIHTEVVANIKSRDEILSFLFSILSLFYFWKYVKSKNNILFWLSLFIFFLALLSKEGSVSFLFIIPLTVLVFSAKNDKKPLLVKTTLFIIPFLVYMLIRASVLDDFKVSDHAVSILDNSLINGSLLERWSTALVFLGKYLYQLLLPISLISDVSYNQVPLVQMNDYRSWLSFLAFGGMFIGSILSFNKNKPLSFALLFFLITIALYSNIFTLIGTNYAERVIYFSSLGFVLLLSLLLLKLFKFDSSSMSEYISLKYFLKGNQKLIFSALMIILFYSYQTIERNKDWKSSYSLYHADIEKSPESAHLRYHYGLELMKTKALNASSPIESIKYLNISLEQFQKALSIYPDYHESFEQIGLVHYRLGNEYKKQYQNAINLGQKANAKKYENTTIKHYNIAKSQYEKSIKLNSSNTTYQNLGAICFDMGDLENAVKYSLKAAELDPLDSNTSYNLGSIYGTMGNYQEAVHYFKKALQQNYDSPANVHLVLTKTYRFLGDEKNAEKHQRLYNAYHPK